MPELKKGDLVEIDPEANDPSWYYSQSRTESLLTERIGPSPWKVAHLSRDQIFLENTMIAFYPSHFRLAYKSANARNRALLKRKLGEKDHGQIQGR